MKKIIKQIMFIMSLILFSCGGSSVSSDIVNLANLPVRLYVATDSTNQNECIEVMNLYNEIFGFEIFVETNDAADFDTIRILRSNTIEHNPGANGYVSFHASGMVVVHVKNGLSNDFYKHVLAHELGHVLGASHMNDTIMQEDSAPEHDLEELISADGFYNWVVSNYGI